MQKLWSKTLNEGVLWLEENMLPFNAGLREPCLHGRTRTTTGPTLNLTSFNRLTSQRMEKSISRSNLRGRIVRAVFLTLMPCVSVFAKSKE